MKLNAIFQGKQPAMEEAPCEVCKVICLTDKEYAFFKKHLMYEYDFLRKNAERMGFHNGIRQCVLVMGENSEDGVLVDSSGYGYARYTAPFLGARSYMALREQNMQVNPSYPQAKHRSSGWIQRQRTGQRTGVQLPLAWWRRRAVSLRSAHRYAVLYLHVQALLEKPELCGILRCFGQGSVADAEGWPPHQEGVHLLR